jgi:hypothetical protein
MLAKQNVFRILMSSYPKHPMKSSLTLILLLSLLTSCISSHYSNFSGQRTWPTTKGAMPDTTYVVPVYRSWPDRPYRVSGSIELGKSKNDWRDADTAHAALISKGKGADAMIIESADELGWGSIPGTVRKAQVAPAMEMMALAIKWKSQSEVNGERKAWEALRTRFNTAHPGHELNDDLLEMSIECGATQGLNLDAPAGLKKLENILNAVTETSTNAASSLWLFRGTFHVTALTNSFTKTIYGLATVARTGGDVHLISNLKGADIRFDGSVTDGRLSGVMDISAGAVACKAKAEGSLVPNRISMDSRGETENQMVRGTFTFLN